MVSEAGIENMLNARAFVTEVMGAPTAMNGKKRRRFNNPVKFCFENNDAEAS
jgi:hypothetical protein